MGGQKGRGRRRREGRRTGRRKRVIQRGPCREVGDTDFGKVCTTFGVELLAIDGQGCHPKTIVFVQ